MLAAALAVMLADAAVPQPVEGAAGQGLMACVGHAISGDMISLKNAGDFPKMGMIYTPAAPPYLTGTIGTPYGTPTFGEVPSSGGKVWAVGYDTGVCLVFVIGGPMKAVDERLTSLFSIPKSWTPVRDKSAPPAQKAHYSWRQPEGWSLDALVNEYEAGPGMVMVTVSRAKGAK